MGFQHPAPLSARLAACRLGCGIVIAGCALGCNHNDSPAVYQVAGTLCVDDLPAANASLAFHPVAADSTLRVRPVAKTQPDGSFHLTTYGMNDGAPDGDYIVTVIWPDDTIPFEECECEDPVKHDRLHGLYADPAKSPLRATVRRQSNTIPLTVAFGPATDVETHRPMPNKHFDRKRDRLPFAN